MADDLDQHPGPLAEAATALYGLVPGEFVAARDARVREARAAKDRDLVVAVGALRRPSAAAWAVNALVRAHGEAVAALLALGDQLRAAQDALAGDDLRRLGREQRAALASARSLVADVAEDAGQPLTEATWRQVEGTLRAAMADADAAAAVRTGRLVEALEPTGFGEVDVSGAVALPEGPPVLAATTAPAARRASVPPRTPARPRATAERDEPDRASRERAERERAERERAEALAAELAAAERAAAEALRSESFARETADRLAERRATISARLAELAAEVDALRAEDRALSRDEHATRADVADAERRARAAARALDALRRRAGRPGPAR